jgi:peptidoglycan/xylan/chitin deacetylase (PgdA/CDA1 family)
MTHPSERSAALVISLDFELYWGVRDKTSLENYEPNLLGARAAIPRILDLFARNGVHATWATVGFLFFDNKDELLAHLPSLKPGYVNKHLSPYDHVFRIGPNEHKDPYHYALSLIRRILQYPGQEIGTHTFSHYYCLEEGQTFDEFRADLDAAHAAARRLGIELKSLVFARNQWRPDYLAACAETGIGVFRGNDRAWMYRAQASEAKSYLKRCCRLADSYVNIAGHRGQVASRGPTGVIDIPASQFLRPFSQSLAPLVPLQLHRIRKSMDHAAKNNLIYHLWWHPHNFGLNHQTNLAILSHILDYFRQLAGRYGMVSKSMGDLIPSSECSSHCLSPTPAYQTPRYQPFQRYSDSVGCIQRADRFPSCL